MWGSLQEVTQTLSQDPSLSKAEYMIDSYSSSVWSIVRDFYISVTVWNER